MHRRQDLALARLRSMAMRGPSAPADGLPGDADDPDAVDPDADDPDADDLGPAGPGRAPARPSDRTPPTVWIRLVSVLAVVALLAGAALLARSWPRPAPQPAPEPFAGLASLGPADPASPAADPAARTPTPAGGSPGPERPTESLTVHVAGDVRRPGIVVLPPGSRVADALAAAGGLRRGAEVGPANLARLVSDGERIEIGAAAAAGASPPAGPGGLTGIVDLNTATAEQLDALPGIGPVTAAKILAWRAEHGRFSLVDELAEVPGIGPKTLAELRPHVRV